MKSTKLFFLMLVLLFSSCTHKELSHDEASARLDKMVSKIDWAENYTNKVTSLPGEQTLNFGDTLPDINKYPIVVYPENISNSVEVEIFVSTEKSGSGSDGLISEVAEDFNRQGFTLSNGKTAQVAIRKIASGTGYRYIASQKYVPDAFSPSNHLWIKMVQAAGIETTPVEESLAKNIAGIVMKTNVRDELKEKYGDLSISNICTAVIQGDMFMGYTNPFASSTGLNFLQTVLMTFADGDESLMLTDEIKSSFLAFQQGVPFVSLTTLQMRESVEKGGSLDAFVMEYQTYINTRNLRRGYVFIPFGIPHDNPLYALDSISDEKAEVLRLFGKHVKTEKSQKLAAKYGFNPEISYTSPYPTPSGENLAMAQQLWKTEKNAGIPIVAVFLTDTSGSMNGAPINSLKTALVAGSEFIDSKNYIGLVTFDSTVEKLLPIEQFDKIHKARFNGAVQKMDAAGKTAMFNGILVSAQMIAQKQEEVGKCKPILFVLTDGDTNIGYTLKKSERVLQGLQIPIYTIGYGYNNDILKTVSSINEAANLSAQEDDIVYQIGELLNAQM